jgi:hypothetical protein
MATGAPDSGSRRRRSVIDLECSSRLPSSLSLSFDDTSEAIDTLFFFIIRLDAVAVAAAGSPKSSDVVEPAAAVRAAARLVL